PASIHSWTLISTCHRGMQWTRAASAQVTTTLNKLSKLTQTIKASQCAKATDGEGSVASLSPAHTVSSVPWPGSVEALSPYSLQVSPCCLLFVLLSCAHLTFNFQCKCHRC
ncbi:unnamed protein product, partial [Tetraodon nigroviridis]